MDIKILKIVTITKTEKLHLSINNVDVEILVTIYNDGEHDYKIITDIKLSDEEKDKVDDFITGYITR